MTSHSGRHDTGGKLERIALCPWTTGEDGAEGGMASSVVRATVRAVSKRKIQATRAALTLVSNAGGCAAPATAVSPGARSVGPRRGGERSPFPAGGGSLLRAMAVQPPPVVKGASMARPAQHSRGGGEGANGRSPPPGRAVRLRARPGALGWVAGESWGARGGMNPGSPTVEVSLRGWRYLMFFGKPLLLESRDYTRLLAFTYL